MNPAKDKPASITSPQEYGMENEERIHKKYGVFQRVALEMKFDILLGVVVLAVIFIISYFKK